MIAGNRYAIDRANNAASLQILIHSATSANSAASVVLGPFIIITRKYSATPARDSRASYYYCKPSAAKGDTGKLTTDDGLYQVHTHTTTSPKVSGTKVAYNAIQAT